VEAIQEAMGVYQDQCQAAEDDPHDVPSITKPPDVIQEECDKDEHESCVRDIDTWRETILNGIVQYGIPETCRLYSLDYIVHVDRCLKVLVDCDSSLYDEVQLEKQSNIVACSQSLVPTETNPETPSNNGQCDSENVRYCDSALQTWAGLFSREFEFLTQREVCEKYFLDYLFDLTQCAAVYKDCTQEFVTTHVNELIEDTTNHCTSHAKTSDSNSSTRVQPSMLAMACVSSIAHFFYLKI